MKKIFYLSLVFMLSVSVIFAKEYEEARKEAEKAAAPLILKKERELKSEDISKKEAEYILDCYKIDIVYENIEDYTTYGMAQALYDAYNAYDKLLNKYYGLYRNTLKSDKEKSALLKEQRAWLKLRDTYFEYAGEHYEHIYTVMGGGTMYSLIIPSMKLEFIKNRVKELFSYYKNGVDF